MTMPPRTILLIEDEADDEALTVRALSKGHVANNVAVARDGAEALEFLLGGPSGSPPATHQPQVVLLDLNLPKVDGLEVLRRLRADERTKFLPIVVLTSSDEERDLVESYRLGANSYVRKPVNFNEFAEAVQHLGLYWLLVNQPPPH